MPGRLASLLSPAVIACTCCFVLTNVVCRGDVVIYEFVASNRDSLADEDGDSPDWIELHNSSAAAVDLAGYSLTDDPGDLTKWSCPEVTLPAGGYLIVFASGKDRRDPEAELHTSFKLDSDGEYLALVAADGQTVLQEFAPTFPRQREDISFGVGQTIVEPKFVRFGSTARLLIPTDGLLGLDWTGAVEPFDDSPEAGWTGAVVGVGYDTSTGVAAEGMPDLIGYWAFDDFEDPEVALDFSGNDHHGTITSRFALIGAGGASSPVYSSDATGRTLSPGDRALDFGTTGNGALVDVPAALLGAFDSATARDAITISIWIFGASEQPANGSVFWGSGNADGTGTRSLNAHVPWGDRTIYWDTSGCCDGTQRILKTESNADRWRGRWNHYVFVKSGDTKQIWQNGELFHEGTNTADLTTVRGFTIGGPLNNGALSYGGLIDDFAVWDGALDGEQIRSLAAGAAPPDLSRFSPLIATDVEEEMFGRHTSVYLRSGFELDGAEEADTLVLRMRYDDGFVAWLNGVEVARRNAPSSPSFDSSASSDRPRGQALMPEDIDVSAFLDVLDPGANVLAVHALNDSQASPEFLIVPELWAATSSPGRYLASPTPGSANVGGAIDFVADTRFSVDRGFFTEPFEVEIASDTEGARVLYTLDGSAPDPESPAAEVYTEPIVIDATTILRARAFKEGYIPTNTDTQTYVRVDDVGAQPARPTGFPQTWSGGFPADYAVDQDVVGTTLPGYGFEDALLAIPSISIVMEPDDLFGTSGGVYYHSQQKSERAGSVELIYPDGSAGFQADAGVRIHGLTSSRHTFTPKHSFRVVFKGQYGPRKLEFPLFRDSQVERFDQFVLKGLSTDTWAVEDGWGLGNAPADTRRWYRENAQYIREQWMKDSIGALGQTTTHGAFVHVFLNGLYWGLYNLTERPTDTFQAEHLGGEREEYDVIRDFAEVQSGNRQAWDEMMSLASAGLGSEAAYQRIQGNHSDGTRNPDYEKYVDVDSLIDYMILHIYAGADDWPNHNWWAGRRRGPNSRGFKFFAWDQEISNNSNNQYGHTSWGPRFELVDSPGTPSFLYARMRANASFRLRFADRVQRHIVDGGALSVAASLARWESRAIEIDQAIVGESARWGDARRSVPFKREVEWLAQRRWLREVYWDSVIPMAMARFARVELYPDVEAPGFSQHGGEIEPGFELQITAPSGSVHYTLDGTDPRRRDGGVAPTALETDGRGVPIDGSIVAKARALRDGEWSALTQAFFYLDLPLKITEIMYHPAGDGPGSLVDSESYEFIELQNTSRSAVDLRGFRMTGGVSYEFESTLLPPGGIVVLASDGEAFVARYGLAVALVLGEYSGRLSNAGETLRLESPLGDVLLDFAYSDEWYALTDGEGPSLTILDPEAPTDTWGLVTSWRPSDEPYGTPGLVEIPVGGWQRPGDLNQDASVDIADAVRALRVLFGGGIGPLPCDGAVTEGGNLVIFDVNADGGLDLSDPIHILAHLFQDGPPPTLGTRCLRVEGCADSCR